MPDNALQHKLFTSLSSSPKARTNGPAIDPMSVVDFPILASSPMNTAQVPIDTPIATVQHIATDLVEVRLKPQHTLSVAGIGAILKARELLGYGAPSRVLFMFPAEETDFDLNMITTDHYQGRPVEQFTRAIAFVFRNAHNERFGRLYFAYFPSPVPSAMFMEEAEARAWLDMLPEA